MSDLKLTPEANIMVKKRIQKAVDLYGDLDHIKESLAALTKDVKSKAAGMFSDSFESAKDKGYEINDEVEDYISERPYQTVGTALLIGLVLGFLLRSKD
jgi:ElaB/YqjD/DUF883 family membrane-anchored ribosome-binding protein